MEDKEITPEQRAELIKVLSESRTRSVWISLKFLLGLFVINFFTITLGKVVLEDTDPAMIQGFHIVAIVLNAIFMMRYYNGQMVIHGDILRDKVKEVLKNEKKEDNEIESLE